MTEKIQALHSREQKQQEQAEILLCREKELQRQEDAFKMEMESKLRTLKTELTDACNAEKDKLKRAEVKYEELEGDAKLWKGRFQVMEEEYLNYRKNQLSDDNPKVQLTADLKVRSNELEECRRELKHAQDSRDHFKSSVQSLCHQIQVLEGQMGLVKAEAAKQAAAHAAAVSAAASQAAMSSAASQPNVSALLNVSAVSAASTAGAPLKKEGAPTPGTASKDTADTASIETAIHTIQANLKALSASFIGASKDSSTGDVDMKDAAAAGGAGAGGEEVDEAAEYMRQVKAQQMAQQEQARLNAERLKAEMLASGLYSSNDRIMRHI